MIVSPQRLKQQCCTGGYNCDTPSALGAISPIGVSKDVVCNLFL